MEDNAVNEIKTKKIMTAPLPTILDDIEDSIKSADEAARNAREAAEEAREAGEKAAAEAIAKLREETTSSLKKVIKDITELGRRMIEGDARVEQIAREREVLSDE